MVKPLKQNGFPLVIERLFTSETVDAFELIHFREPESHGDEELYAFEAPSNWSGEATSLLAQQAALKAVPAETRIIEENTVPSWLWRHTSSGDEQTEETSVRNIFHRVAGAATYAAWKEEIFSDEAQARAFFDEARYLLAQRFIALEPRYLAACGLTWAYGLAPRKQTEKTPVTKKAASFETDDLNRKQPATPVSISNTSIDAILAGDKNVRRKWQKLIASGVRAGSLNLRFSDIAADWNTGPASSAHAAIDLLAFRREDGFVDIARLQHAVKILVMLFEFGDEKIGNSLAIEFNNAAPLIMSQALAYDSDSARATAAALAAIITAEAYATSAHLASMMGPALTFAANRENIVRAMRNHCRAAYGDENDYEKTSVLPKPLALDPGADLALMAAARYRWDDALELTKQHGLRFLHVTDLSPAPELGFFMESSAYGIAPMSNLSLARANDNGVYRREIQSCVKGALIRLGYSDTTCAAIVRHIAGAKTLSHSPAIDHSALRRRGFDHAALQAVENYLPNANDIRLAFTPWILGETFCHDVLRVPKAKLRDARFDLLRHIGFSQKEIVTANAWCYGQGTAIGAKDLRPSHTPIFAQAREISAEARIRMAAAVQGLISGDAGLHAQLSSRASVNENEKPILSAWRQGVKSFAVTFTREIHKMKVVEKRPSIAKRMSAASRHAPTIRAGLSKKSKASGSMISRTEQPARQHDKKNDRD